jgi:hypothetical protein
MSEQLKEAREKMLKLVDELAFNTVTERRYDAIRREVADTFQGLILFISKQEEIRHYERAKYLY